MIADLPESADVFMEWSWSELEPVYADLHTRDLTADTVQSWLLDWSRLSRVVSEIGARLYVALTRDTTDQAAEQRYFTFVEVIQPAAAAAEQTLKERLLASGLQPAGLEVGLRNLRAEAALFRQENLPLLAEENKLVAQHDKLIGAQTVTWEGVEIALPQLRPVLAGPDRAQRERAWTLMHQRQLASRDQLNALWQEMLALRGRIAANAGYDNYRDYVWQASQRFDYTPDDCLQFHQAIEQVAVPAATRVYERHRQRLGLETLRPWDLSDGWFGRPAAPVGTAVLRPFQETGELTTKSGAILWRVDPQLGEYFETMVAEHLLDLDNRTGKAPGGYCSYFAATRRPFIFMNSVGVHDDVQTMLHEAGHAFHSFEIAPLPYYQQGNVPTEFSEVASMAMELLAAPYLPASAGGFYSETDAARARVDHLESMLLFWPFMAVVDAFQHWVYSHPAEAVLPERCDTQWQATWRRFMPAIDWSGRDDELVTGWQRKLHIFQAPFYYVEYGLAALGATQVWRNALSDQAQSVARYRQALALGGTERLPRLYATAGATFAFDAETLGQAVTLIEATIAEHDSA